MTGPDGGVTSYEYSNRGERISQVDPVGAKTTWTYDGAGRMVTMVEPRGNVTGANPADYQWTYGYDAVGRKISETDPLGRVSSTTYDALGRATNQTRPDGSTATLFDPVLQERKVTTTDQAGRSSITEFDALGRVVKTTDARGFATLSTYDAVGNQLSQTAPDGGITTWTYDSENRVTSMVDPRGSTPPALPAAFTTTYAYDIEGHQVSSTDPLGRITQTVFDTAGRADTTTDPGGKITNLAYDAVGRVRQVNQTGQGATKYVYDTAGNLRTRTDQLLRNTTHDYDLGRRLVKQTDPLGRFVTHSYDADGRRTQTVDAVANQSGNPALGTTTYTYDRLGRTIGRAYSDGTPAVSYSYDTQGRRTSMTDGSGTSTFGFDTANRMVSVTDGAGTLLMYTYDANNNVLSVTDPFNGTTTRTVDNVGRITSVSANEGAPTEYVYDPAGLLTRIVTPDSHEQRREYDPAGRLTTMFEGTPQVNRRYAYAFDPSNNITSIAASGWTGSDWSVTPINLESRLFLFDAAGRLRRECVTAGTCTTANSTLWTYDQIGRRLTEKKGSAPIVSNTYDAADQLVSATNGTTSTAYGYNANGDQTVAGNVTSTFNTAHQTKTVTTPQGSVTYGYDGDGNRVTGGSSRYVWDRLSPTGVPDTIAELNGTTVLNRYRFGPLGPAVMTLNGNTAWPVVDHVGTIRQLIQYGATVAQYTTDAWGNRTTIGTPAPGFTTNSIGYTGQYSDPLTGNLHLRARQYNPTQGTFTQTDPMPMGAGSSYEATYVYAGDNPNIYSDPSGLRKTKCNTSLGRQAGASFLGLASTFVPFYNRDFSQCEAQAVSKILAPATIVGSTLAAGSCGTLVGIGTLNPQMAAGAAGACGGVASGVAGGNLNLPDVSWGFAEGYSTAPPGNVPRPASKPRISSVDDVMTNPNALMGKTAAEVEAAIGNTPGWRVETLRRGSQEGNGWVLREYSPRGNPTGRQIRWHPGGGHHGPDPLWKVNAGQGQTGEIR